MAFISPHVNAKAVQAGASYDLSEPSPSGSESGGGGGDLPNFTSKPGLPPRGGGGAQQLGDQSGQSGRGTRGFMSVSFLSETR